MIICTKDIKMNASISYKQSYNIVTKVIITVTQRRQEFLSHDTV